MIETCVHSRLARISLAGQAQTHESALINRQSLFNRKRFANHTHHFVYFRLIEFHVNRLRMSVWLRLFLRNRWCKIFSRVSSVTTEIKFTPVYGKVPASSSAVFMPPTIIETWYLDWFRPVTELSPSTPSRCSTSSKDDADDQNRNTQRWPCRCGYREIVTQKVGGSSDQQGQ